MLDRSSFVLSTLGLRDTMYIKKQQSYFRRLLINIFESQREVKCLSSSFLKSFSLFPFIILFLSRIRMNLRLAVVIIFHLWFYLYRCLRLTLFFWSISIWTGFRPISYGHLLLIMTYVCSSPSYWTIPYHGELPLIYYHYKGLFLIFYLHIW